MRVIVEMKAHGMSQRESKGKTFHNVTEEVELYDVHGGVVRRERNQVGVREDQLPDLKKLMGQEVRLLVRAMAFTGNGRPFVSFVDGVLVD